MKQYAALILAAGKGTRMKSGLCKVLHPVAGRPMISYVMDAVHGAGFQKIVVVVGHQADGVRKAAEARAVEFVVQEPQLGTGHAVLAAKDLFQGFAGDIFILCGDIPLIQPATIREFLDMHEANASRLTVMTALMEDPAGYGRIIRNESGLVERIVEQRDADASELAVKEINTGLYIVDSELLYALLEKISANNSQGEYYLTDIIEGAVRESVSVYAFPLKDAREASGVNTRSDLAGVSNIIWARLREELMNSGVTLLDPASVYVDSDVTIGSDSVIHPGVTLSGRTDIGRDCVIESGVYIMNSKLGDRVTVLQGSRLDRAVVQDDTSVGPMANLRPEARIGKRARIGNFVEVKKTVVGDGTKAAHLTYLGDSIIGKDVNIGCGTITCNYDGQRKHTTTIRDGCFVGSDVQFVAPVEIGAGSLIGAGSTITRDVPPNTLAISRAKQKMYPLRKGQGAKRSDEDRDKGT
ncbi:MAG: bifunctional UDP-N-acetylglucosamine diphosphorylase/glucosamine-1-phosphate N-acetyltransferase GlmU [Desulfomonile tiedjei]|nr:bifunctional UDP-N-acetylglucosamine diphosphorylase/glucosamine-1-phosphate N-acetyltransferase GlmU [Desulfomonile tiedjei]